MVSKVDYGEKPQQMDDYGMDRRHYERRGDCSISSTYGDEQHHCGEDVNEEGGNDETETD